MKGFVRLEKKYGITVKEDRFYNPFSGKFNTRYKIYTADGCQWENGLTKDGVKKECEEWSNAFIRIKNTHDDYLKTLK